MSKDAKKSLSNDESARFAGESTDGMRADAERNGTLLPIWQNGRVVNVDPSRA